MNIRELVDIIDRAMGPGATADQVEAVANEILQAVPSLRLPSPDALASTRTDRAIVTAYGHDRPGILAAITDVVSKSGHNIQDVSQKIMQGYFTLIMLVEMSGESIQSLQAELTRVADTMQVRAVVQHEELFNAMHRP